ncbi:MAG: hypothetical protein A2X82_17825 [Geobacteraceae bacterium GWC2_55_20]|nr:MAG: hypothetical protein A2X82_17825 [Geobacteraceae bacterium GWC2_55_20]OGU21326.1 MAG: hypothetical protein A2X85_10405 [Geobacteraceae bacterium GWF2_54_21]HBA72670.1 hypothetical protein [Geobacter sp.]HCE69472.1 hypothetical protein [Geobacter sp.]
MKALATLIATLAPATAFAASTLHEDNSGIFVWVFLGFCALIVVVQVMPAVILMLGFAKGLSEKMSKKQEVVAHK